MRGDRTSKVVLHCNVALLSDDNLGWWQMVEMCEGDMFVLCENPCVRICHPAEES